MPSKEDLTAKQKAEQEEQRRSDAIRNYYESAKLFANCAVGDVMKRAEYVRMLKTAERTMRKTFDDAEARMTSLSLKALRGERI